MLWCVEQDCLKLNNNNHNYINLWLIIVFILNFFHNLFSWCIIRDVDPKFLTLTLCMRNIVMIKSSEKSFSNLPVVVYYCILFYYILYNGRYLQEYTALGTAGGIYHFRDQIRAGSPHAFFLVNGDVCGDFPLQEMYQFHESRDGAQPLITLLATEATRQQSCMYGCIGELWYILVYNKLSKLHFLVFHSLNIQYYTISPYRKMNFLLLNKL